MFVGLEKNMSSVQRYTLMELWNNFVMLQYHCCYSLLGIGFAICVIATYMAFFYNTVISWAVYFMVSSFRSTVPWKTCDNAWNTENCAPVLSPEEIANSQYMSNMSNNHSVSAAAEFFMYFFKFILYLLGSRSKGF